MIITMSTSATEEIYNGRKSAKLPQHIQRTAYRKLMMLDAAKELKDLMAPPGNRLEKLADGSYSIRINDQYRIVFKWIDANAYDVQIIDYH
jgi:toxin HigB-1